MARLRNNNITENNKAAQSLGKSLVLALASAVVILIFSYGAYQYSENNLSPEEKASRMQANKSLTSKQVESTIVTDPNSTATSSPAVVPPTAEERLAIQVKIVNGTGQVNGADQVAKQLEQKGYKIGSVEMGQLYTNVAATIRYSKGSEKEALEMNNMFNNQAEMQVGEELINYIVVILGKSFK